MVLWSVILACTYNLEDLNQVRHIDHKAQRTIQVGLKYSRDKLPSSDHYNLPLNGILELDSTQASHLLEWDPHSYQKNFFYEKYINYIATDPDLFLKWGDYMGHPSMICRHEIELNGLQSLDVPTAEILSQVQSAGFELNGLTHIEPAALHALTDGQRFHALQLNGLTEFTPEHAVALTNFRAIEWGNASSLHLEGVTELDVATLNVLKDTNFAQIYLGLKQISPEQAKALAQFQTHKIHFVALQELSFGTARELMQAEWLDLYFPAVMNLSVETAEILYQWTEEGTTAEPVNWAPRPIRRISMAAIGNWEKFRSQ